MGTIKERPRKSGDISYFAQIVIKRGLDKPHREQKTFPTKREAQRWIKDREAVLKRPGAAAAINRRETFADAIRDYRKFYRDDIGRSRAQVLRTIETSDFAKLKCAKIGSPQIQQYLQELSEDRQPQTTLTYAVAIQSVFSICRPAYGYELDPQAIADALKLARRGKFIAKSKTRDRRPTLAELDAIMGFFQERNERYPESVDMLRLTGFALFSGRRQEEICRIRWDDLDDDRVLVRDMKNPAQKIGNDIWVTLPAPALAILAALPRSDERIFPANSRSVSAFFTRACKVLEIEDLRFHDLRHECASWLAEKGWTIPQIAAVTGHRGWQGLQRYSHVRKHGDRYENWPWLAELTKPRGIE